MLSLLIPFAIVSVIFWSMFVPSRLEFSDTEFTIKFPLRPLHVLEWSDLKYFGPVRYWGPVEGVFMIEFVSVDSFQILPQAFRRSEWRMFENFLSAKFPDRRASWAIGNRMFRWPWKET
jgi:hypothetical protein